MTLDDQGVLLTLSESNEKCGHHYITLGLPEQPKFKLEWEDVATSVPSSPVNRFKLYSVIDDPLIGGVRVLSRQILAGYHRNRPINPLHAVLIVALHRKCCFLDFLA